jgi:hypothetical protein
MSGLSLAALGLLGVVTLSPQPVQALPAPVTQVGACSGMTFFGFPSWDSCLPKRSGSPAITSLNDVWLIAFPVIESMIRAAGYLAVGFILYGGFKFMKSQGDPGQIAAARTTIQNAIAGLVIAILSVAVVRFIAERF